MDNRDLCVILFVGGGLFFISQAISFIKKGIFYGPNSTKTERRLHPIQFWILIVVVLSAALSMCVFGILAYLEIL
jgi:hypothetical protein